MLFRVLFGCGPSRLLIMLIWLLAFVLLGVFGYIGYKSGAVRASVALIGTWVALVLGLPVGALASPLVARIAKDNAAAQQVVPPLIGFVLVWGIFYGLSFLAHRPVFLHFKYREDDATRAGFERLNQVGGLFFGALIATVLFFQIGKWVYTKGYVAVQFVNEENDPRWIKLLASARSGMDSAGWNRAFAALDETPERWYQVVDLLGFVHENPAVMQRLRDYPPFLSLSDKQEYVDLRADADFQQLLSSKPGFSLMNHYRAKGFLLRLGAIRPTGVLEFIGVGLAQQLDTDFAERMRALDLDDLMEFLKTGTSPEYDGQKVLGRWKIDVNMVLLHMRRNQQNITPSEFRVLREKLNELLKPVRLTVYPEGTWVFRTRELEATPEPVEEDPYANPYGMDPALAARYGGGYGAPAQQQRPAQQAERRQRQTALSFEIPKVNFESDGTWDRVGIIYKMQDQSGTETVEARFDEKGRFIVPIAKGLTLYFVPTT